MLLLNAACDELRCAASACRCVHTYAALHRTSCAALLFEAASNEAAFKSFLKAAFQLLKAALKQVCFDVLRR